MTTKTVSATLETKLVTPGLAQGITDWEKLAKIIESIPKFLDAIQKGGKDSAFAGQLRDIAKSIKDLDPKDYTAGVNAYNKEISILSGMLKSLGTISKSAKTLGLSPEETKTQTEALREFAKAMREASQAAEEFQRQRQVKAGTFGMDSTTLKGVDAAIKKIQGDLLATKQMIDTLGLDKRKTVSDPIVAHGAQLGRNLQNLEGLRSGIVSSNYANALELDRQRDIVRAQTEKAELERAQKKKEAAEQEKKTSQTRQASAAELVKINAESDKLDAEIDQRKRKAAIKDAKDKKDKADRYVRGREADDIKEFGIQGVLRARGEDGRYVAAQNTTRLARGEGRQAFIDKGADSDQNTLLKSLRLTPADLLRSVELRGIYQQMKGLAKELGNELIRNKNTETEITAELSKQIGKLKDKAKEVKTIESRQGKDLENDRATNMMARTKGQGGAALLAVQASLIANYAVLQGVIGTIQSSVRNSVELEAALKNVQAVTVTTNTEMKGLDETIRKVAASSKFSSLEVAQAALTLGQAGLSAKEVGIALESVVKLATASGTSIAQAVDLVTSVVGVFDKTVKDTADIANKITQASNSSKISVDKLALGLQYAGNIASQLGVTFEETTAAMAAMSNAGIMSGSTMGTGLRQFMVEVQKPSKEFLDTLHQIGLSVSDVDFRSKGLVGVIQTLRDAGFSAGSSIKSFDVRGAAAFNALLADPEALRRQHEGLLDTKAAMAANEIQMDSLQAQAKRLTTSFENFTSSGMGPMSEVLKGMAGGFATLFQTMSQYPGITQAIVTGTTAFIGLGLAKHFLTMAAGGLKLMQVKGTLLTVTTALSAGLTTFTTATIGSTIAAVAAAPAVASVGVAAGAAAPRVWTLTAAMHGLKTAFMSTPITLAVTLVIAALGAAYLTLSHAANAAKRQIDESKTAVNDAKASVDEKEKAVKSLTGAISDLYYKEHILEGNQKELEATARTLTSQYSSLGLTLDTNNLSFTTMVAKLKGVKAEMQEILKMNLKDSLAKGEVLLQQQTTQFVNDKKDIQGKKLGPGGGAPDNKVERLIEFLGSNGVLTSPNLTGGQRNNLSDALEALRNTTSTAAQISTALSTVQAIVVPSKMTAVNTAKFTSMLEGFKAVSTSATDAANTRGVVETLRGTVEKNAAREAFEKEKIFNGKTFEEFVPNVSDIQGRVKAENKGVSDTALFEKTKVAIQREAEKLEAARAVLEDRINSKTGDYETNRGAQIDVTQRLEAYRVKLKAAWDEVKERVTTEVGLEIKTLQVELARKQRSNTLTAVDRKAIETQIGNLRAGLATKPYLPGYEKAEAEARLQRQLAEEKNNTIDNNTRVKNDADNLNSVISSLKGQAEGRDMAAKGAKLSASSVTTIDQVAELAQKGVDELFKAKAFRMEALLLEQGKRTDKADEHKNTEEYKALEVQALRDEEQQKILNYITGFRAITSEVAKRLDKSGRVMTQLAARERFANLDNEIEERVNEAEGKTRGFNLEVASGSRLGEDSDIKRANLEITKLRIEGLSEKLALLGDETQGMLQVTTEAYVKQHDKRMALTEDLRLLNLIDKTAMTIDEVAKVDIRIQAAMGALKAAQDEEKSAFDNMQADRRARREVRNQLNQAQVTAAQQAYAIPQEASWDNLTAKMKTVWELYQTYVRDLDVVKTVGDGFLGVMQSATGAMATFFTTLVSRTATAKEAFRQFAVSVIKSMMDVLAQALAMQAVKAILGAFVGGGTSTSTSTYSLPPMGASPGPGALIRAAKGGPVKGGIPGKDSVGILAMPGEFVLRKSAADAVGEDFLNSLNHETKATVSSSAGPTSSLKSREPDTTNIWIVAPEAKPTMGPKDVVMVITDDMLKGGVTKKLIQQIQTGAM
jgi:TP901 family phage tail tape measure protein